jgi:hypothetical protein
MKLKTTITGKVHGVGYRVKLINMALEYGIDKPFDMDIGDGHTRSQRI